MKTELKAWNSSLKEQIKEWLVDCWSNYGDLHMSGRACHPASGAVFIARVCRYQFCRTF